MTTSNAKPPMSQATKIWLGVGVVVALCLCAALVSFLVLREAGSRVAESFKTDPTSMAEVGGRIAEFDVPPGYHLLMAMSILNYDTVMLAPTQSSSSGMIIMMMQFPGVASADPAQMEEQMRRAMEQQGRQPSSGMTVVEQRTETIRGDEVTVTVSESRTQGASQRQWLTIFQGNGGPTMLMIQGPTTDWDDELIENFIKSIR